ncbi:ATPase components of various ABC-type transport systems, contain duplicated ATPase [Enterococcus durans]|uniref:ATPase components of various ABC-type transport systems, contain duplicated ATPase n=1 Tax=Enterococcus durans TaxID=53345 RepID=A0A377KPR6_9ENTE|nr:ABC transporter ATP-binding protein [Enterococcus durans]STP30732.1 ATPase components of various ABC-type transport systems, contain duplicated ATPase [Enterococcus durans]
MIEFHDFTFQYDSQAEPTLKNINLSIKQGEKILIMGPSGSGKSTLGKCLNGIIPQNEKGSYTGSLNINGKLFGESTIYDLSLDVGTVLQDTDSQFVGLTVAEDIAFSLENEMIEQTEMRKAVNYWSEKTNLSEQLEKRPQDLSGGQKQRVTMAGVLIDETPILLFDEPLANLDPQTGYEAIQMIDQLYQSQKFTTIIIEHRLEEVLAAPIDRVILMNEGTIIADSTPTELLKSDLLTMYGIREPLYISALKRAGISLEEFSDLTQVDQLVSPEIATALAKDQGEFKAIPLKETPLLTLKNISFGFGDEQVIKKIDLTLYQGEMVSLVGHNGAGKSTLSNLITGFYPLQTGELLWKGQSIATESIKERADKIGYVLQNSNQMLSKNMIFEEVALGLKNQGVDPEEIQEKVFDTLKVCGLYEFRNWPISALSHGQKRRVAIAAILVLEPEFLILDEPTAGQDYYHYNEMMTFLRTLNQQGITILMITHDMHLMLEHTRRTLVLKQGQIIADETPANVLSSAELVASASLRETSLYRLAQNNHLADATDFVSAFIQHEEVPTDGRQ